MIILPTSNSWWIFDEPNSRFRRIPKDLDPEEIVPNGDWKNYFELEIDADSGGFVVFLNSEKTQIMRGYIALDEYQNSYDSVSVANNT